MTERHEDNLQVHQTLHGYSHGHQLVAKSYHVSREAEREMLVLSDLSGPRMIPGFESYLTGYPLLDSGYYVLAKTWYAHELERPGCVWTHSLLIPAQILASAPLLAVFGRVLERPTRETSLERYTQPIPVPCPIDMSWSREPFHESVAALLLRALYGSPAKPTAMIVQNSSEYEQLVLRLWSQQWQRLRVSFSFCTGALAPRRSLKRLFDLQFVPIELCSAWLRDAGRADIRLIDPDADTMKNSPDWIKAALRDICSRVATPLGDFLATAGQDISERREAFQPLVKLHCLLSTQPVRSLDTDCLVALMGEAFPDSNEARWVKEYALWGNVDECGTDQELRCHVAVLRSLANTPHVHSFDPTLMQIRKRAATAWTEQHDEAAHLLVELIGQEQGPSPLAQATLTGFVEAMRPVDVVELARRQPGLAYLFVKQRPELAASDDVWGETSINQSEVLNALADSEHLSPDVLEQVIAVILSLRHGSFARPLLERFGNEGVDAVLNVLSRSSDALLPVPPEWIHALASTPSFVVNWFCRAGASGWNMLPFVIQLVPPQAAELESVSTGSLVAYMRRRPPNAGTDEGLRIASFLLSIGLRRSDPAAAELVSGSFDIVHVLASEGRFSSAAWRALGDQLPKLPLWEGWDTCKKLTLAAADRFVRHDWPMNHFVLMTTFRKSFERLVKAARKLPRGRAWIARLADRVASGDIDAAPWQKEVLVKLR